MFTSRLTGGYCDRGTAVGASSAAAMSSSTSISATVDPPRSSNRSRPAFAQFAEVAERVLAEPQSALAGVVEQRVLDLADLQLLRGSDAGDECFENALQFQETAAAGDGQQPLLLRESRPRSAGRRWRSRTARSTGFDSFSLCRRAVSRLGTSVCRRQSARRSTAVDARSGASSVQGWIASTSVSSTALSVIASSNPAATSVARTRSRTRSSRVRVDAAIFTLRVFGNLVVAVDAGDFLDEVDLAGEIGPPSGRNHLDAVVADVRLFAAEGGEDLLHLGDGHLDAEDARQLRPAKLHDLASRLRLSGARRQRSRRQVCRRLVGESIRRRGGWPNRALLTSTPRSKRYDEGLCR